VPSAPFPPPSHSLYVARANQAGVRGCKVTEENIFIKEVPGAYELPYAAKLLAMSGTVDAIICCGVLIKGDTLHFEYISSAVTSGIMNVNLATMTPVIYGVLNCLDEEQVKKRSSDLDGGHNHGVDWGKTAVEMAILRREAFAKGTSTAGKVKDMEKLGFGVAPREGVEKTKPGFF
jgi:6,7-dimethyl-8-ribityllumazine synthase